MASVLYQTQVFNDILDWIYSRNRLTFFLLLDVFVRDCLDGETMRSSKDKNLNIHLPIHWMHPMCNIVP